MQAIKRTWLVGTGLVSTGLVTLGLLGAVFAQGMMQPGGTQGQGYGQGMMGGGMGMMSTHIAASRPISQDEAKRRAQGFATRYGAGVKLRDFMVFTDNFYLQVVDASGAGLSELLVDRYTGVVQPEYGPNMIWNTRFGTGMTGNQGSQGQGMMGNQGQGMMGATPNQSALAQLRYNQASAQKLANTFLVAYLPGAKVLEGLGFPGYFTFDYGRKGIEGMLSVSAFTGDVWVHTWHGLFLGEVK